jgi:Ca2+-binding RTX toxin-like protein
VLNLHLSSFLGGGTGDLQVDAVTLTGSAAAENITATQAGSDVLITGLKLQVTVFTAETNDVLTINAQGGNDTVDVSGITSVFALTIDGGAGDDTITGSSRADILLGGDNNDTITGRQGNDIIFGGNGNDTFVWNPGDGSDVLEGQAGTDKLVFNGSNATENMSVFPNGARFQFLRDVANVTLDCDDVEKVQVFPLGGADTLSVNELTATDVKDVAVDLAATGGSGDGQIDNIIVNGTQTNDTIVVSGSAGAFLITGLSVAITVTNSEPAIDNLTINALGGHDNVDASSLASNVIKLTINGGLGNDTLLGSQGGDMLNGGDGNDAIFGSGGNDTFTWNPGDDNDIFDGQAGNDTLQFNGANIIENIVISALGGHLSFFRDVANVTADCDNVEIVSFAALGGADTVTINDLSTTDVTAVNINLAASGGAGDAAADNVIINGTGFNDGVTVTGSGSTVNVFGLPASVTLTGSEAANDRVTLNTLNGDDSVDASTLPAGIIALTEDGGNDADVLTGSAGADTLLGGAGDDVLKGGPGVDVLDGGTGTNILIQD